jgi:V/A-type H+/Na+-transporting ATPase subunit E
MESKLQELTNKLYSEGIEKARMQAQHIIEQAQAEATTTIEKAQLQANEITEKAKSEAHTLLLRTQSEIKQAGEQSLSVLKQEMVKLLAGSALAPAVKDSARTAGWIKDVVTAVISRWNPQQNQKMELVLPADLEKELASVFKAEASKLLASDFQLKFESRMKGGFKIQAVDNAFVLSFSDEDFVSFFQSFLRPRAKEILFPEE